MKSLLLSTIISLSIVSCGQTLVGNGNLTTITKQVSAEFDAVSSSGSFDVDIIEGPQDGKIKMEGESNILEKVKIEVKNNRLSIEFEKNLNIRLSKAVKITLTAQNLKSLGLSGSGTITAKGTQKVEEFTAAISGSGDIIAKVKANKTTASISGSGDVNLSGTTENFKVGIAGSGDVLAYDLIAKNAEISVSGSGDTQLTVQENLKGSVAGSGDIFYKGNPSSVKVNSAGSGDIKQVK
jgi:hypothetical protein